MAVLLAVGAAVGWGASDYFGGDATRRDMPVFVVVAIAELLGVALLVPVLIARGTAPPADPRLLLACVAGVAVTIELGLIYRALSRGEAFITAPTGALGTAAAVTIGLIAGDPLSLAVGIGLVCALLGGAISAWTSPGGGRRDTADVRRAALTCLGAAAAIGAMLTSLHAAGGLEPYWATATEHAATAVSAGLAAVIGTRRRPPVREILPRRAQLRPLALVAAVGVGGDLAYATASHAGALSIVAAIASLYPVATIGLGRVFQGQRANRIQLVGITLAMSGAALLGAGN
jgi:drug/metabolite transporter (DMT)-like permease